MVLKKLFNKLKNTFSYESGSRSYKHGVSSTYTLRTGPNSQKGFTYEEMIARCRYLAANNEYAKNALTIMCDYVIGHSIDFDYTKLSGSQGEKEAFRALMEANEKKTVFDFYRKRNLLALIRHAINCMYKDGSIFLRSRIDTRSPFGVSFQLIEVDHLAKTYTSIKLKNGGYITNGIEYDSQGREVAFHLYKSHPNGDNFLKAQELMRVRVDDILLLTFNEDSRVGQSLGIPLLSPVVVRLGQLAEYDRSQLKKQTLSGMFSVILKKMKLDGFFGNPIEAGKKNNWSWDVAGQIEEVGDGTVLELNDGYEAQFPSQPRTDEYEAYHKVNGRLIGVGVQIPTPLITGDVQNVNLSSMRGAVLPFNRRIKTQRATVVPLIIEYIFTELIQKFNVRRFANIEGVPKFRLAAGDMFDPVKEADALYKFSRLGVKSMIDIIGEYGSDSYEDTMQKLADHKSKKDSLGLVLESDPEDDLGRKGNDDNVKKSEK